MNKIIDTNYDFRADAKKGYDVDDLDKKSPTLRAYHKILWSKPIPNGQIFKLSDSYPNYYLYHKSELGEFSLGSDAITHSYYHKNDYWKKRLSIQNMPDKEVKELYDAGYTIGAYIIFPNNQINGKQTINSERGCNDKICDRFDLTLECIRRFYLRQDSPLYDTLLRYEKFFNLFNDFKGYVDFFLLQDLIDDAGKIKFYLEFDGSFENRPIFKEENDYLVYKNKVLEFITKRNERINKMFNIK
jgi:hypothetical protein